MEARPLDDLEASRVRQQARLQRTAAIESVVTLTGGPSEDGRVGRAATLSLSTREWA